MQYISKTFNEVYKTDNVIFMKTLPDKIINVATEDPPYGIGESSKNHNSRNTPIKQKNGSILLTENKNYIVEDWDDNPPCDEYFEQLFRISLNQIIWGANYFKQIVSNPFKPPRRNDFQDFVSTYPKGWILWDKLNGKNDFNDCELAWTSFDRPTIILPYLWAGMMQGISIQYGNIQRGDKKLNEKRFHPTQKPMPINRWILKNYVNKNEIVFDGCVGSGGSRIASYDYGVNYIGCEKSEQMFNIQENRFKQHIRNLKFDF